MRLLRGELGSEQKGVERDGVRGLTLKCRQHVGGDRAGHARDQIVAGRGERRQLGRLLEVPDERALAHRLVVFRDLAVGLVDDPGGLDLMS